MNKLRFVPTEECGELSEEKIKARKKRLREYMKRRRSETENRDVKEDLLVAGTLEALKRLFPETVGAVMRLNVFIYLSFSSEAPTDKLTEALKEQGASLYAPRIENGEMYAVEIGEDFTLSPRGIREPIGTRYEGKIDAAITPLLAADGQGNRLGYGGGYYDAYFAKHKDCKRIGYCFDLQICKALPRSETDQKLDCIVTEKRTLFTERNDK